MSIACYDSANVACYSNRSRVAENLEPMECRVDGPCSNGGVGYVYYSAMRYAVDVINNSSLLPNTKVVLTPFDTRGDIGIAVDLTAAAIAQGYDVIAGGFHSYESTAIASLDKLACLPQMSGSSTSPVLSDKTLYPFFARAVGPDNMIFQPLVKLFKSLGWSHFSTICTTDDFAKPTIRSFVTLAEEKGLQVVTSAEFRTGGSVQEATEAVQQLIAFKSKVVVIWCLEQDAWTVFQAASNLNAYFTFVGSASESHFIQDRMGATKNVALGFLGWSLNPGNKEKLDTALKTNLCPYYGKDFHEPIASQGCYSLDPAVPQDFAAHYHDTIITIAHVTRQLIANRTAVCHNFRINPCLRTVSPISWNRTLDTTDGRTCAEKAPCTVAWWEHLKNVTVTSPALLTGPVTFNKNLDRLSNFDFYNWQENGAVLVATYSIADDTYNPDLPSLLATHKLLFNDLHGHLTSIVPLDVEYEVNHCVDGFEYNRESRFCLPPSADSRQQKYMWSFSMVINFVGNILVGIVLMPYVFSSECRNDPFSVSLLALLLPDFILTSLYWPISIASLVDGRHIQKVHCHHVAFITYACVIATLCGPIIISVTSFLKFRPLARKALSAEGVSVNMVRFGLVVPWALGFVLAAVVDSFGLLGDYRGLYCFTNSWRDGLTGAATIVVLLISCFVTTVMFYGAFLQIRAASETASVKQAANTLLKRGLLLVFAMLCTWAVFCVCGLLQYSGKPAPVAWEVFGGIMIATQSWLDFVLVLHHPMIKDWLKKIWCGEPPLPEAATKISRALELASLLRKRQNPDKEQYAIAAIASTRALAKGSAPRITSTAGVRAAAARSR